MTPGEVVRCPVCGQANRIPKDAGGRKIVCGRCKNPLTAAGHDGVVTATDDTFAGLVQGPKPVVMDFWAAWCGPCRQVAPLFESLAASRKDVTFAKMNVDENPATPERFRVSGIPTFVFLRNGQEKGRIVGAVGRPQIEQAIRQYFGSSQ